MDFIDLTYYKILPQQSGSVPKILVSEITNEIEFLACTDTFSTTIDYSVSKIMDQCGINSEPVVWGSDLRFYEDNFVTLTKFDLSKEWVYFGDSEKIESLKNNVEIDFIFLMTSLLGGTMWSEDLVGFVDDNNNLKKSFHYNSMFEVELAMYSSGLNKAASIFDKNDFDFDEMFDDEYKDVYEDLKPLVNNFLSIKKSDWFDILKFPQNSKYEKSKYWIIKKISDAQKILKKHF